MINSVVLEAINIALMGFSMRVQWEPSAFRTHLTTTLLSFVSNKRSCQPWWFPADHGSDADLGVVVTLQLWLQSSVPDPQSCARCVGPDLPSSWTTLWHFLEPLWRRCENRSTKLFWRFFFYSQRVSGCGSHSTMALVNGRSKDKIRPLILVSELHSPLPIFPSVSCQTRTLLKTPTVLSEWPHMDDQLACSAILAVEAILHFCWWPSSSRMKLPFSIHVVPFSK